MGELVAGRDPAPPPINRWSQPVEPPGDSCRTSGLKNTALACAAAAVVGLLYLTIPQLILAPFLDSGSDQALTIATHLPIVTAFLQFFDCAQNIGVGLLRGLDDTKSGFRITLIGYWAVGLPASWLFAYALNLDTLGICLGLLAGLATTAVLLLRRYSHSLTRREQAQGAPAVA
ncbi:MATE family efflux transporter [Streptomyces nojiriensis]|uniref:MATE family efflux transporter n=1 Tax=Streptomyces nojiriensis TaxID=66374 RepID=UPI0036DA9AAF